MAVVATSADFQYFTFSSLADFKFYLGRLTCTRCVVMPGMVQMMAHPAQLPFQLYWNVLSLTLSPYSFRLFTNLDEDYFRSKWDVNAAWNIFKCDKSPFVWKVWRKIGESQIWSKIIGESWGNLGNPGDSWGKLGESWGNLGYPGDNKIWPEFFPGHRGCVGLRGAHRVIQNSGAERGGCNKGVK